MRLVRQRDDSDCGVAAFAMLTDRTYEEALAVLAGVVGELVQSDGQAQRDIPDHTIKVLLQREGWFLREIWR